MASFNFLSISPPKKFSLFFNICFIFLLTIYLTINLLHPSINDQPTGALTLHVITGDGCSALHNYTDYQSKCRYIQTELDCQPKGYINYLRIFYCACGQFPQLGHAVLFLWLLVLFYLLGNTTANYFCSSLESLSRVLKLSPTIAGVTLLSLGNGASDVFASIVSFTRSSNGDVGLNSVLGGAFFVSSVVVGIISMLIAPHKISVDKPSFIRDTLFFLFSLFSLLLIILIGRINLWASISFVCVYVVYVCVVSGTHIFCRKKETILKVFDDSMHSQDEFVHMGIPLLGYVDDEKPILVEKVTNFENQEHGSRCCFNLDYSSPSCFYFGWFIYVVELPLYLPRRLTIPVVTEERWSKPFAVISAVLAPILMAFLCDTQMEKTSAKNSLVIYMIAGLIGVILGNIANVTTHKCSPPKKCLFPWLVGGFLMSVTWTYIIAEELVSLLVSIGIILGISPSILGLTVLAWGNSLGDLIANVAMAVNGGADGVQIAISGCYAGPMFNTLVGLGISMVFSSWSEYPSPYVIPIDHSLYETLGFLMAGLLWALVILPKKKMILDRFLGGGLVAIYLCFLFLRLARAIGLLQTS